MMAMVRKSALFAQLVAALPLAGVGLLGLGSPLSAGAQAIPRITSQVENSGLVSLPNSVHPWARAQFDRGPAPANMSGRMVMVLKRSPEQEAALQTLLAAQQDPRSPEYQQAAHDATVAYDCIGLGDLAARLPDVPPALEIPVQGTDAVVTCATSAAATAMPIPEAAPSAVASTLTLLIASTSCCSRLTLS